MQPLVNGRPPYPCLDEEQRKVARDAYMIPVPAEQHPLMRRPMNSLVCHLRCPAAEFGVEVREDFICIRRLFAYNEVSGHPRSGSLGLTP